MKMKRLIASGLELESSTFPSGERILLQGFYPFSGTGVRFHLLCMVMRKERGKGRGRVTAGKKWVRVTAGKERARVTAGRTDPGQIGLSGVAADSRPMHHLADLAICLVRLAGERAMVLRLLLQGEGRIGDSRSGPFSECS